MGNVLLKSGPFIFLIILGYVLKKIGLFGPKDYKIPVKIVLNVTLPCAAIVSFASYEPDFSLLLAMVMSIAINCLMFAVAYILSRSFPRQSRAMWLNCLPGYNIGAFAMPFIHGFLPPASVASTCLFDAGNAVMCCGTTYALSKNILDGTKGLDLKLIGKTLLTSVPFLSYMILLILTLSGVRIPRALVDFVTPMANANSFLAMFMVGMMLDFHIEPNLLKKISGLLVVRLGIGVCATLVCYFLLPLPLEVRQALSILSFAPISATATALAETAGSDPAAIACANSTSILVSIICMMTLLAVFGIL